MIHYTDEYRINKKGAECFRSSSFSEIKERFMTLNEKRPGVYTIQRRHCRLDKYGCREYDHKGRPNWTPWGYPYILKTGKP